MMHDDLGVVPPAFGHETGAIASSRLIALDAMKRSTTWHPHGTHHDHHHHHLDVVPPVLGHEEDVARAQLDRPLRLGPHAIAAVAAAAIAAAVAAAIAAPCVARREDRALLVPRRDDDNDAAHQDRAPPDALTATKRNWQRRRSALPVYGMRVGLRARARGARATPRARGRSRWRCGGRTL